jgi:hypothetical protein
LKAVCTTKPVHMGIISVGLSSAREIIQFAQISREIVYNNIILITIIILVYIIHFFLLLLIKYLSRII